MRWLRTHFVTEDHENADLTLDVLVDDDNRVVARVAFCGWWGRLKCTDMLPLVVLPGGKVDFGSDEDIDQTTRFGHLALHESKIERGASYMFQCDDDQFRMKVESYRDLTEGLA